MAYISEKIKIAVRKRSKFRCEYCLVPEMFSLWASEIEHIISKKHGGNDELENLAGACSPCNRNKGSDIGSIVNGKFVRFFNPRKDKWSKHFAIENAQIIPLTTIGEATINILRLNDIDRIMERQMLIENNLYTL